MHIYIANNTQQNQHFYYRVPERPTVRQAIMAPGKQIRLPDDLDEVGQEFVIEQLTQFGGVRHDDPSAITRPFSLIYRVGKPIGSDDIDVAVEKESTARQDVSAEMLEETGLTNFAVVGANGAVQSSSLEVVQLEDISDKPQKDGVNVEIAVDKKAAPGKIQRGKRNGK